MCGIAGIWSSRPRDVAAIAGDMAGCLVHRGPDDSGVWTDGAAGVAFGFRRLSIIDLTPAGHQPMLSASGRYTIVFNGEVYNFAAIRAELEAAGLGPAWRGHSDTEVLLAAFEAWGIEAAVPRFNGMFAIAVWDAKERVLRLVRDRMGVKPLYYAQAAGAFVFGSELKALAAFRELPRVVSRDALALYMRFNAIAAPYSIFEGVRKVTPGAIVTVSDDASRVEEGRYWTVAGAVIAGLARPFAGSDADAIDEVERAVTDAVRLRMIADVPLGVFLSGGIDSSLVASLMQMQSAVPVKTFSIGFTVEAYNEAKYAAAVARHLGTDHTELYLTPEDAQAVVPLLPSIYDEPFGDSSQIPTFLVSRLARERVVVSLSGDGGDELFGGYQRYFLGQMLFDKIRGVPRPLRRPLSALLRAVPMRFWDRLLSPERRFVPSALRRNRAGERIHKLAGAMISNDLDFLYRELVSQWDGLVPGAAELPIAITATEEWPPLQDAIERMMYFDQVSYLTDDILTKVDRASMAVSLESREPLLDHRLLELAWSLPLRMKVRDGKGKWVLRGVLERHVPRALFERPKMGFGVPIDRWLRGPLRDWAESLLDERRLRSEGYLDVREVRRTWGEHLSGRGEWHYGIWTVLMFEAWLDGQKS